MKRKFAAAAGIAVVASLSLAACSGNASTSEPSEEAGPRAVSDAIVVLPRR